MNTIRLSGLRGETLLGFLAALGTLRVLSRKVIEAKLAWSDCGGGWVAELHVPNGTIQHAEHVAETVFAALDDQKVNHPILQWERFLGKTFSDESEFFCASAMATLSATPNNGDGFAPVFSTQIPVKQGEAIEHFDHPFRAARKDYYLGNLQSVLANTELSHVRRTIVHPWDYRDAMANQSLRLDHGDDRRHAYQWYAPTEDPARQKVGCMLGANRLALEAFPLFPCVPRADGGTAVGFVCKSKTFTWVSWPIWTAPCSLSLIVSLLNLGIIHETEPSPDSLRKRGIAAVLRSRRLPIEKNKVFLPPVVIAS
jgi:CRISPR-associated endonuclease/helicase Cas3